MPTEALVWSSRFRRSSFCSMVVSILIENHTGMPISHCTALQSILTYLLNAKQSATKKITPICHSFVLLNIHHDQIFTYPNHNWWKKKQSLGHCYTLMIIQKKHVLKQQYNGSIILSLGIKLHIKCLAAATTTKWTDSQHMSTFS